MKNIIVTLVMLTATATAGTARAQHPVVVDHPGFDLGLRLGYAIPFGDIDANPGGGLASQFSGGVPFVLEGGYRFSRALTVGALFQYAVISVKDNGLGCGNGVNCSGSVIRLGAEVLYHVPVASLFVPWVGAGLGYEWMNIDGTAGGATMSIGANGFEFLTLQGGGDYRLSPQFSLGPFASLSLARYSTLTGSGGGVSGSMDIGNPAMHEWLQLGVRGSFNL